MTINVTDTACTGCKAPAAVAVPYMSNDQGLSDNHHATVYYPSSFVIYSNDLILQIISPKNIRNGQFIGSIVDTMRSIVDTRNVNQLYHRFDVQISPNLFQQLLLIYKLLCIRDGHTDLRAIICNQSSNASESSRNTRSCNALLHLAVFSCPLHQIY